MSYRKPDTGNPMNDYFTALTDFYVTAPKLLSAGTAQEFDAWLDKLARIDARSTVLYIRENKNKIPDAYLPRIRLRLGDAWPE